MRADRWSPPYHCPECGKRISVPDAPNTEEGGVWQWDCPSCPYTTEECWPDSGCYHFVTEES